MWKCHHDDDVSFFYPFVNEASYPSFIGKYLVSVGFSQDGYICLWDWRNGVLVTKVKACSSCSSVESVCFSSDAKFIVTAGKKHLKLWKVGISIRPRANVGVKSLVMHGKPMNIGFQKGYSFIAVTSPFLIDSGLVSSNQAGENLPIYGLTDTGGLAFVSIYLLCFRYFMSLNTLSFIYRCFMPSKFWVVYTKFSGLEGTCNI